MITQYDQENMEQIINNNHGDWFSAHLYRFLNKVLSKADQNNQTNLYLGWPDACKAIYRYWEWPEEAIKNQMGIYYDLK